MFRDDMDEAEAEATRSEVTDAWLEQRMEVQTSSGESCHTTRRFEEPSPRGTRAASASRCRVSAVQRLYAAYMFTDDPVIGILIVVGVQRALRALRVWRRLTDSIAWSHLSLCFMHYGHSAEA